MVMLFPVAPTTTLPTPSHYVLPSALVLGPLLWSILANLLSLLQVLGSVLGSTPVCTSLRHCPLQQSLTSPLLQVSAHNQRFLPYTHVTQLYSREMGPERAQSIPGRVVKLRSFTVSSGKPGCGSHSALLGQGQVSTIYSKYQAYHVCQSTPHYPRTAALH